MQKILFLCLLAVVSLCPACKKDKAKPCEVLYGLPEPPRVGLLFVDKETGENIILSKNIDSSKITVTPYAKVFIGRDDKAADYGAVEFYIAAAAVGPVKYTIDIPGVGMATFAYANVEKESGSPCIPARIVPTEPFILEYSFTEIKPFLLSVKI